jgi:hypothetical protein
MNTRQNESKKHPVMVRLADDDRDWIRKQAHALEKLTGTYSESAVIRMAIRKLRQAISEGLLEWELQDSNHLKSVVGRRNQH